MKDILVSAVVILLATIYSIFLYKREVRRNRERIARMQSREQAWLIEQENNLKNS